MAWWGPGVMQIDWVRNCGCTCYRPYAGRSGGGSALEAGLVPYSTCTVRYRYHTVLRCPVWYRLAPMKTQ